MPSDDDIPRFAVLREFVYQYGDDWATLGAYAANLALLATLTHAAAEQTGGSFWTLALHSAIVFFLAGFWWVLWSDLFEDALERHG